MAPRASAHDALLVFTNYGGWSRPGLFAMIGLTTPMSVMIGYDCSVHMSEEIKGASITLPRAIMWSLALNASLGFSMAVTLAFTLGDVDSLFDSVTRQPFIQGFYNATRSYAGTNVMVAIIIVLLRACTVSPGWNIPLSAVFISLAASALLSLVNLGSYVALNAINSLGGLSIPTSFYITIGCLNFRRLKGPPLPTRRWSLGRFGLPINIGALRFLTPMWFFAFWPLTTPTTAEYMSWSSLMFGVVITFVLIYYFFRARHVYTGPMVLVKRVE